MERKGSVVATTTISQTFEGISTTPSTLAKTFSAGEEGDAMSQEEALEFLGDPPLARGLLLLAEMSSEGNLMGKSYTQKCVETAREHQDFVLGFIAQRTLNNRKGDNFVVMTPGVNLPPTGGSEASDKKSDGLGQQYRSPAKVIGEDGCDIIIVGRGIISAKDRKKEAERYRDAAWKAYEARVGKVTK
jgi:uridine monophosphate synthetase